MKYIKSILLGVFILSTAVARAQQDEAPAKWHTECKSMGENAYEFVFHLELKRGWHVFTESENMGAKKKKKSPSIIIPTFTFDKAVAPVTKGPVVSKGLIETKHLKHYGLANVYSYKVLYSQPIETQPGAVLTGTFTYQLCDENAKVYPAVNEHFSCEVK